MTNIAFTVLFSLLLICVSHANDNANGSAAIQQHLLNNIEQAQQQLNAAQVDITQQRQAIAKELVLLEEQVRKAKQDTAAIRRANDERSLSLDKIGQRVEQWQKQQDFQFNALDRYLQKSGVAFTQLSTLTLQEKLGLLDQSTASIKQYLQPSWQNEKVVFPNGSIADHATLALGPAALVLPSQDSLAAGLAEYTGDYFQISDELSVKARQSLVALQQNGEGEISIDPTLTSAKLTKATRFSVLDYISQGGIWVFPILLAALGAFSIALLKSFQLFRLPTIESNAALFASGKTNNNRFQNKLVALMQAPSTAFEREDVLFAQLQHIKRVLNKRLTVISVTATVAPLLGLLGTVSGMIETFRMMASLGSSDPEVVSGGIGQALVTTELGLIVAIPSLIFAAILTRRAKRYYDSLEQFSLAYLAQYNSQNLPKAKDAQEVVKNAT
jgi:biopolymer transport protein ExbB